MHPVVAYQEAGQFDLNPFMYPGHVAVPPGNARRIHRTDKPGSSFSARVEQAIHVGMKSIGKFFESDNILESQRKLSVDYVRGCAIGEPGDFHGQLW